MMTATPAGISLLLHQIRIHPGGHTFLKAAEKLEREVAVAVGFILSADMYAPRIRATWMASFSSMLEREPDAGMIAAEQVGQHIRVL